MEKSNAILKCHFSNGAFIQKTHKISVSDNEIHVD